MRRCVAFCCVTNFAMAYIVSLVTLLIELHLYASDKLLQGTEQGLRSSLSGLITDTDCLKVVKNGYRTEESPVFTTKGALECWQFCWLSVNCQHMQFDSFDGKCWLSHGEIDKKEHFSSILISSSKECFREHLRYIMKHNLPFEIALKLSLTGSGVRIQSTFDKKCLKVVGKVSTKLNKTNHIAWKPCLIADSWNVLKIENTDTDKVIGVKISLSSNPLWCLDGEPSHSGWFSGRLTLKYCHVTNIASSPLLGIHEISAHIQAPILSLKGEVDYDAGLAGLFFLEPTPLEENPCYPTQFKIKDAAVYMQGNQPFFLPGSAVTIMCDHGFGVKKLNYSAKQVVQCSKRPVKPSTCSVKATSKFSEDCELYLCVATVLSTVVVAGILLGVTMAIKHHNQAQRPKRMEDEISQTTTMTQVNDSREYGKDMEIAMKQ